MTDKIKESFDGTRMAGSIASDTLDEVAKIIKPGIKTERIDKLCFEFINDNNAYSAPLFYRGYPKSCCTSSNHIVCHGIPSEKVLKDGDIINVDVTAIKNGWHGDTSRMFFVGEVSPKAKKLVNTTYEALIEAIKVLKNGIQVGDIGFAIQKYVEERGFSVVRDFCGHGLGRVFHSAPSILHYGTAGMGAVLQKGMFFTIEPMINAGKYAVKILPDGWTAVTRDRSLSAQFEHSLGVTEDGCELFTVSPLGLHKPPYDV